MQWKRTTRTRVLLPNERGPAREEKVWEVVVKITYPIIEKLCYLDGWLSVKLRGRCELDL